MRTTQQAIADAIAKRIMANTRKKFSALHADALTEVYNMSNSPNPDTCTSQVPTPATKQVGYRTIEGSNAGDHRPQTAPAVLPAQPAPRDGMGEAKMRSSKLDAPKFESTATALDSDAGV